MRELERALAEARLAQQRAGEFAAQLESILDNAPNAIYLKGVDFTYRLVNREFERLSQRPRAEVLGRTDFEVFPQPVAQLFRDQDLEVLRRAAAVDFRETIPLPGGVHSFITAKFPLRTGSGQVLGVAGVCTEITQLALAQQRLEETQLELVKQERLAMVGELSAVIAHEVRNPLGVVFNSLAALEHTLPPGSDGLVLVDMMREEADRLNRMVGALLELAQPYQPKRVPCCVHGVAASAIEAARALAEARGEVRLDVRGSLPLLPVDAQLLRQALVNLVSNALQAHGRRGPVTVRISREDAGAGPVRFEVVDDGAGIPPALAERVFAPFFTTRAKGIGLGLTVVRRVADAHGGTVTLQDSPGGGATFVLRIPVGAEPEQPPATEPAPRPPRA